MVIDTSAIIVLLLAEPEAEIFADAIARDSTRLCSAVSLFEASIVIETRRGSEGLARLDLLVAEGRFVSSRLHYTMLEPHEEYTEPSAKVVIPLV